MVWLWHVGFMWCILPGTRRTPMPKHHHFNLARRRGGVGGKRNLWERVLVWYLCAFHVMIQLYRLYSWFIQLVGLDWPWWRLRSLNHWPSCPHWRSSTWDAAGKELSLPFWSQHANVLSKCLDFGSKGIRNHEWTWTQFAQLALVSFSERSQGGSGKWSENSQSGGKWGANSSSGNKWSAWSTNSKSGGSGKWKANSTSGKSYSNTGGGGMSWDLIQDFDSAKLAKYILKTFQGM